LDHEILHEDLFTDAELSLSDQNIQNIEVNENFLNYKSDQSYEGDQNMLNSEMSFNEDISEDILEELEPGVKADYPNETYADLMTLITKYKLSNATGNAIIKFFNKHANFNTSPLPKSIEQGRKYMDNMNLPNFMFDKTCIITYNNNEYYLHHRSLINCIKNILSISDISKNFAINFKNLKVRKS